jgi:hypothetical protein
VPAIARGGARPVWPDTLLERTVTSTSMPAVLSLRLLEAWVRDKLATRLSLRRLGVSGVQAMLENLSRQDAAGVARERAACANRG